MKGRISLAHSSDNILPKKWGALHEALLRKVDPKLLTFSFHLKTGTDVFTPYLCGSDTSLKACALSSHLASFHTSLPPLAQA